MYTLIPKKKKKKWIKSNKIRATEKRETTFDSLLARRAERSLLFEQRLYQEPTKRSRSWLEGGCFVCGRLAAPSGSAGWLSNRSSGSRSRALCYVTRTAGISLPRAGTMTHGRRTGSWLACSSRAAFSANLNFDGQVWNFTPLDRFCFFPDQLSSTDTEIFLLTCICNIIVS